MDALRAIMIASATLAVVVFPPPARAQDAEARVYASASTCVGLRAYVRAYPNGRFKSDADARITKECAAPKPTPVPAPKPAPSASTAPKADPCAAARAEWGTIDATHSLRVLKAFLDATPSSCHVVRAQAEDRMDALNAAAIATAELEAEATRAREYQSKGGGFDGVWVLASGANYCFDSWSIIVPLNGPIGLLFDNDGATTLVNGSPTVIAAEPPELDIGINRFRMERDRLVVLVNLNSNAPRERCEYTKSRE